MKILNIVLITLFIAVIITYAVLASKTKYNAPNIVLTDEEKRVLYATTIFGYILGFILITIETSYLITEFNNVIIFRFVELILILTLIFISYYSYIYQENVNEGWGKVSAALWPLMIPMTLVAISCAGGIYLYYSTSYDKHKLLTKSSESYSDNRGGRSSSDVFIDSSETDFNEIGGDSTEDARKQELQNSVRSLIF